MLRGDGEQQQDVPHWPSTVSSLFFYFRRSCILFPSGEGRETDENTARAAVGERRERKNKFKKKEETDLWEDYGICVTIKPEGNAADTFAKRDSFSADTSRLQRAKTKADKRERIWRGKGRRLRRDSAVFLTSTITELANRAIKMSQSSVLTVFWLKFCFGREKRNFISGKTSPEGSLMCGTTHASLHKLSCPPPRIIIIIIINLICIAAFQNFTNKQ